MSIGALISAGGPMFGAVGAYGAPAVVTKKVLADPKIAPPQKESISEIIGVLEQCEQPEMPLTHRFSPGIYCREVFMPAAPGGGTYVVGHVHKTRHQNIVLTGRALVTIDGVTEEIVAPFVFESDAGAQKLLHIVEDMRWMTVHANPDNITDIPTLENMIFDLPEAIRAAGIPLNDFRMQRNQLRDEQP
jgi:hypothetical protein